MSDQKKNRDNRVTNKNQFDKDDTYGVFKQEMEVDTDVNEDPNRESLLDESVDSFLKSKGKRNT
ncbi:hypothetical protein [Alkalihalobacillus sp. AL-G]|uniref:hypothetical protein n=1 Tax=Alkalihalobacillus sp. AL-G TaxID=2926399 RepID=UPI00272A3D83|nr:hypothetical protein [Alkalihalobacillus sp. AL-G]WLD92614.1 hypothetical protein MOJ78_16585 [Alkalihalobacillus sp. AL-G]